MDIPALYHILAETTFLFRHGASIGNSNGPSDDGRGLPGVHAYPHISTASGRLEMVSLGFVTGGVDMRAARFYEREFIDVLDTYPDPVRLAEGPSYREVGAILDSEDAALRVFALGKVFGLWSIITPSLMGLSGLEAACMARDGFLTISGWQSTCAAHVFAKAHA